jgi:hypothetical protein
VRVRSGSSGSVVSSDTVRRAFTGRSLLATNAAGVFLWVAELQAQSGQIDVAVAPEQEGAEAWLGEHVENALSHKISH